MKGSTPLTQALNNICDQVALEAETHRALAPILLLLVNLFRTLAEMLENWRAGILPLAPAAAPRPPGPVRPTARPTARPRIRTPRIHRAPAVTRTAPARPRPPRHIPTPHPTQATRHQAPPRGHTPLFRQKADFTTWENCVYFVALS